MKRKSYLILLGATIAVAAFGLYIGLFRSSDEFAQLMPPPGRPPDVHIALGKSPTHTQPGVLSSYDWLMEGEVESFLMNLPFQWPSALAVSEADTLTVRLNVEAAPSSIEIRQYRNLDPEGAPEGQPSLVTSWENPRIFGQARAHAQTLFYRKKQEIGGWEIAVPLTASTKTTFIFMWVTWIDPVAWADPAPRPIGPYSANWIFSVEKDDAS